MVDLPDLISFFRGNKRLQVKAEEKTGKPESANRGEKAASTDERDITEELN
jgi:hypothetical protein